MVGEPTAWTGEAPSEQDYADAGKKKRGRPSPTGAAGAKPGLRSSGRERPMPQRGGPPSERGPAERGPSMRGPTERSLGKARRPGSGRPREEEAPARREILNTGQRRAVNAPGLEPQPEIGIVAGAPAAGGEARVERPLNRVRTRDGERRPGGRHRDGGRDGARDQGRDADRGTPREAGGESSRDREPQAPRQPAAVQDARQPRAPRREQAPRDARPAQPAREPRPQPARAEQRQSTTASSFADNVPAFLRKPVRPVKAASE